MDDKDRGIAVALAVGMLVGALAYVLGVLFCEFMGMAVIPLCA